MHLRFLPCFFLLLATGQLWAQDPHSHRWGVTAGWTETFRADELASPLLYQADELMLGGMYQRRGRAFFEIGLQLNVGTIQAQRLGRRRGIYRSPVDLFGRREVDEYVVNPFLSSFGGHLRVRALWPVGRYQQLGFSVNTHYQGAGMGADFWQYAQLDLSPEYQFAYPLWRGRVEAGLGLPLLAFVVRPNYAFDPSLSDETNYFKGYLRTGSRLTSVHEFLNPRLRVGYTFILADEKELGGHFHMTWTSLPDPRPLRSLAYGLAATYVF